MAFDQGGRINAILHGFVLCQWQSFPDAQLVALVGNSRTVIRVVGRWFNVGCISLACRTISRRGGIPAADAIMVDVILEKAVRRSNALWLCPGRCQTLSAWPRWVTINEMSTVQIA
jgi:hypothetical protein